MPEYESPETFDPEGFEEDENQRGDASKETPKGDVLIPPGPWHEFPEFWDRLQMEDKDWPGLAKIERARRANKWDTKKAKGSHGGTRSYGGADLATFAVKIRFWSSEQYDEIVKDFLPMVEPDPGKEKAKVVKVSHAVLHVRKITHATIDDVEGPDIEDGYGIFVITCTEHRDPEGKNATGKATANQGNRSNGGKNNARCQELAQRFQDAANRYNKATAEYQSAHLTETSANPNTVEGGGQRAAASTQKTQASIEMNDSLVEMDAISREQKELGCGGQTQAKPSASGASDSPV